MLIDVEQLNKDRLFWWGKEELYKERYAPLPYLKITCNIVKDLTTGETKKTSFWFKFTKPLKYGVNAFCDERDPHHVYVFLIKKDEGDSSITNIQKGLESKHTAQLEIIKEK